jgi:hypothetical protein
LGRKPLLHLAGIGCTIRQEEILHLDHGFILIEFGEAIEVSTALICLVVATGSVLELELLDPDGSRGAWLIIRKVVSLGQLDTL